MALWGSRATQIIGTGATPHGVWNQIPVMFRRETYAWLAFRRLRYRSWPSNNMTLLLTSGGLLVRFGRLESARWTISQTMKRDTSFI
jgi:hypothetical protein